MLRTVVISLLLMTPSLGEMPLYASVTKSGQTRSDSRSSSPLRYCKLLEGARRYSGKQVRVTAHWRFGFETTILFEPACPERTGAWLEFADDSLSCPESERNRNAPGPHDKEAEVIVTGRLIGPGRYGHLGAYEYKFVATCLEKIKITDSDLK